jgi:hypothetical protein
MASKKKIKPAVVLVLGLVVLCLASLTYYMLSFEYKKYGNDDFEPLPKLLVTLNVVSDTPDPNTPATLYASFTISNIGTTRVSLVDTVATDPLYEVQLQKQVSEGRFEVVPIKAGFRKKYLSQNESDEELSAFKIGRDSELKVLPGRGLNVRLPLSDYDLTGATGGYRVSVTYRADALFEMLKPEVKERLSARAMKLSSQCDFELPFKK